jgi:transposase
MSLDRAAYPSDVSDEEWALVAPDLALLREDSKQRDHDLREVFNGLRYIVKTGAPWRFLPHDLPPWAAVYQQVQRWLAAECFTDVAGDLRAVLRMAGDREPEPSALVLDSRTLRSSPESGERAGYDGPSASAAPRCIWRWTRPATWWRCTSHPPMPTTAARWAG